MNATWDSKIQYKETQAPWIDEVEGKKKTCQYNKDITVLWLWQVKSTIKHTVWELTVWERKLPKRERHKI